MIKSFKHKGLEDFFKTGNIKGINPEHKTKIKIILTALNSAKVIDDMDIPSFKLHKLKGDMQHLWSVTVRANYRITFGFENGEAYIVDYQDYH